jgi:hypothetical protein
MYRFLLCLLLVSPLLTAAQAKLGAVVLDEPIALPAGGGTRSGKADQVRQNANGNIQVRRSLGEIIPDSTVSTRPKREGFFMLRTEALGASSRVGYGYRLTPWLRFYGGLGLGYALSFSSGGNRIPSSISVLYDPAIEVPLFFRVFGMAARGVFRPYYLFELGYTYRYITAGQENLTTTYYQQTTNHYSLGSVTGTIGAGSMFYQQKGLGLSAGIHVSYQASWNVTETNRVWLIPGQSLLVTSSGFSHLWQPGIGLQLHF